MKYFNNKTAPIYVYDGSFDGLLCCLFSMFEVIEYRAEAVKRYDCFLPCRNIESSGGKVEKVKNVIMRNMGHEPLQLDERAYLW